MAHVLMIYHNQDFSYTLINDGSTRYNASVYLNDSDHCNILTCSTAHIMNTALRANIWHNYFRHLEHHIPGMPDHCAQTTMVIKEVCHLIIKTRLSSWHSYRI